MPFVIFRARSRERSQRHFRARELTTPPEPPIFIGLHDSSIGLRGTGMQLEIRIERGYQYRPTRYQYRSTGIPVLTEGGKGGGRESGEELESEH